MAATLEDRIQRFLILVETKDGKKVLLGTDGKLPFTENGAQRNLQILLGSTQWDADASIMEIGSVMEFLQNPKT